MPRTFAGTVRARSPRRLILVFAATILLPALLLGFFGLSALLKESELADQEIRRRLEAAADDADLGVRQQLLEWQQVVDIWTADPTGWPARLRAAVAEPGQAVVLRATQGRLHAYPRGQILCTLGGVVPASKPGEPLWTRAEACGTGGGVVSRMRKCGGSVCGVYYDDNCNAICIIESHNGEFSVVTRALVPKCGGGHS